MSRPVGPLRRRISWWSIVQFYALLLFLTGFLDWGKFTTNVDQLIHDSWVRLSQRAPPEDVVIVGIDAESLDEIGRWPWSRDLQATLYNRLANNEIRLVALDLIYVEPDVYSANDQILADAVSQLPNLILPVLAEGRGAVAEYDEKLPIPELTAHAKDLGHIFIPLDSDGIVRRVYLKSGFNAPHWSTLALSAARVLDLAPADEDLPGTRQATANSTDLWVEDNLVMIPFYGPGGTFTNVSALDVITNKLPPGFLKDKIVFVGMTATGLGDVLPTAVSAKDRPMPGVEIHANVFSAIRNNELVTAVDTRLNYLVAGILILLVLFFYSRLPPLWGLTGMVLLSLTPVLLSFVLYRIFHFWYAPLVASIPLLVSYFFWSWHRLEYVAAFLQRETEKLVKDLVPTDDPENFRLVQFFENASLHLPLAGWRFKLMDQQHEGGEVPDVIGSDLQPDRWHRQGDTYSKRYNTAGDLNVSIRSSDDQFAEEFEQYVDRVSQVMEQQRSSKLSGTLERVQSHTYQLSHQLDRLRQTKVLGDSIFADSPAGLIVWSASGELVRCNALANDMLPAIDIESHALNDFIQAVGRDPINRDRDNFDDLIRRRIPWQINLLEKDTELVVNFSACGDTLAERLISASIVDVSEIRRSERSRAELVDFLSHDLRSPLISSLYLLKSDEAVNNELPEEKAQRIETNINLSLEMIDDLLAISRADNLKSDAFVPMLFDAVVGNAIDILSPQARSKSINLDVVTLNDELWLACDPGLLERALVNIIGNSIKYSPDNTIVRIETSRVGDQLIFRVTDQGVGIAPEMMGSLFQRFKRDKKVAQKYKGIGLGLALVARVINEHGGKVHAESPGLGTTIHVELPLALDVE